MTILSVSDDVSAASAEVLALGLLLTYALVGFGLRAVVQIRHTGDSGFRGLGGTAGTARWWAGVLFAAAILATLVGPIAGLLGLPALSRLDSPVIRAIGVVAAVLGIVGTYLTQLAMGNSWRIGVDDEERTDLVTSGPFGIVRNPIFSLMVLTVGGAALVAPNPVALLGAAIVIVAIHLQVRVVEEPHLHRVHGPTYADYARRTGRFLPGLGLMRTQ